MKYFFDTFRTPLGEFSVALDETGAVVAAVFGGADELRRHFSGEQLIHNPVMANWRRR
jgi:hypothetical protein